MKLKIIFILSITALLLSGCATTQLGHKQCLDTDWHQLGVTDGAKGYQRNIQQDVEQCAKLRIKVNPNEYLSGWRKGLNHFCTYEKGINLGAKGKNNPHICPGNLRHIFNAGYQKGAETFCQYAKNAYTLASKGGAYPTACSIHRYPEFYTAYQQGLAVYNREMTLQKRIDVITNRINLLVNKFDFQQREDASYQLGERRDSRALNHLNKTNQLAKEREKLENQLFKIDQT